VPAPRRCQVLLDRRRREHPGRLRYRRQVRRRDDDNKDALKNIESPLVVACGAGASAFKATKKKFVSVVLAASTTPPEPLSCTGIEKSTTAVAATVAPAAATAPVSAADKAKAEKIFRQALCCHVNTYRAAKGLPALGYSTLLKNVTTENLLVLAKSHKVTAVNSAGKDVSKRLDDAGYSWLSRAEFIFRDCLAADAKDCFDKMAGLPDPSALLSPTVTTCGGGAADVRDRATKKVVRWASILLASENGGQPSPPPMCSAPAAGAAPKKKTWVVKTDPKAFRSTG